MDFSTYFSNYPDEKGYFGEYGGAFLPPELQTAFDEIYDAYMTICKSGGRRVSVIHGGGGKNS